MDTETSRPTIDPNGSDVAPLPPAEAAHAAEVARAVSADPKNPDQQRFNTRRLSAHIRANEAANSKGITDLQRAQLTAVSKLAGIQFTIIRGEADATDAESLRGDLEMLWRIVDPLIEAFGSYSKQHFDSVDLSQFKDQLQGALGGNATFVLDDIAEGIREQQAEYAADPVGWAKAQRLECD